MSIVILLNYLYLCRGILAGLYYNISFVGSQLSWWELGLFHLLLSLSGVILYYWWMRVSFLWQTSGRVLGISSYFGSIIIKVSSWKEWNCRASSGRVHWFCNLIFTFIACFIACLYCRVVSNFRYLDLLHTANIYPRPSLGDLFGLNVRKSLPIFVIFICKSPIFFVIIVLDIVTERTAAATAIGFDGLA